MPRAGDRRPGGGRRTEPHGRAAFAAGIGTVLLAALVASCGGDGGSRGASAGAEPPAGPLERNLPFPDVAVLGLDSTKVGAASLLRGHETIVLFISTSCETCSELVRIWNRRADRIPEGVRALLIVDEEVGYAADYARKNGIRLPLYCDTRSVFGRQHKMDILPSAAGVRPDGTVAFVRRGATPLFTPERAVMMLRGADRPR